MEIWLLTCQQLCSHCSSTKSPKFSLPEYKQGKSTLASLSLTCRAMAAISQPVLYHSFHHYPGEDTESNFLRTLVSQPQLARFVRVLYLTRGVHHLYQTRGLNHIFPHDERHEVNKWHEISVNLGIQTPQWLSHALSGESSSDVADFDGPSKDSVIRFDLPLRSWRHTAEYRSWKQLLILGICSTGLTHLDIPDIPLPIGIERRIFHRETPDDRLRTPFNFKSLRVFSCQQTTCLEGFPRFLSHAPLLNNLTVGLASYAPHHLIGETPSAPLQNVTALSVVSGPLDQEYIFHLCCQVRDLDFRLLDDYNIIGPSSYEGDPWPTSMKKQLRRLCWTTVSRGKPSVYYDNTYPPLLDLKNLEILEIDRRSLTICLESALGLDKYVDEAAKLLPTVLPRSLRILHFTLRTQKVTLSTLLIELEALAAAKETTLPMLSLVQIDDDRPVRSTREERSWGMRKPLWEVMDALGVFVAMKKAGIELTTEADLAGWHEGGMLPLVTGNQEHDYLQALETVRTTRSQTKAP